jgi:hypothetical protein
MEIPSFHCPDAAAIAALPHGGKRPLCRDELRALSRDTKAHPLVAYACIMAWGGRDFGNYRRSLDDGGDAIIKLVEALRKSTATRRDNFQLTQTAARSIPGLGISFYTKLLFFLRKQPNAYILDQWTAKSSIVLFPELGIRLTTGGLPDPKTSSAIYEAFCSRLETCCGSEGWGKAWKTGEEVERTLFDSPKGDWRRCLKTHLGELKLSSERWKRSRKAETGDIDQARAIFKLTAILQVSYEKASEFNISLPEGCGGFNKPNRFYVRSKRGLIFQFILNKNQVRAQIYLGENAVHEYKNLVDALNPKTTKNHHDFGCGVMGNGPKQGLNRTIDLAAEFSGGWGSLESQWSSMADSAVEAMASLFQFTEPYFATTQAASDLPCEHEQ